MTFGSVYFVAWSNIAKIVHQHRSAYRCFFKNNMSFSRTIFDAFSSKNFTDLFLVIPCFHIAKKKFEHFSCHLVAALIPSHTIPIIWWHHTIPHRYANRCWWKMTSAWGSHLGFIRSCQNPIGRAQPKNWNLWLCHIRQRSGKKYPNFDFGFFLIS